MSASGVHSACIQEVYALCKTAGDWDSIRFQFSTRYPNTCNSRLQGQLMALMLMMTNYHTRRLLQGVRGAHGARSRAAPSLKDGSRRSTPPGGRVQATRSSPEAANCACDGCAAKSSAGWIGAPAVGTTTSILYCEGLPPYHAAARCHTLTGCAANDPTA